MAINFKPKNKRQLNLIKAFFRFLKKRDIYGKYIKNHEKYKLYDPTEFSVSFGYYLIGDAFQWSDTDEGITFWSGVSNEWVRYFDKNKLEIINKN